MTAPLLVVEPTFGQWDHAAVNGAILRAVRLAFPQRRIVFAAAARQRQSVLESYPDLRELDQIEIGVLPPGGVTRARFVAQWRAIRGAVRTTGARTVLLLSGGPETFFVARLLVALDAGLRLFVVLHGLTPASLAWRSRDPRRRLFDYRAGMGRAQHERIRFIALEQHIAEALPALLGLRRRPLVWPHPLPDDIDDSLRIRDVSVPLRIVFPGTANAIKGFDVFSGAARKYASAALRFELVGYRPDGGAGGGSVGFEAPDAPLPRATYVERLSRASYAMLPLQPDVYRLTASGSMMDCIALRLPLITTANDAVLAMEREFGAVGFIFRNQAELGALLGQPEVLADAAQHAAFRAALGRAAAARGQEAMAVRIGRDLA